MPIGEKRRALGFGAPDFLANTLRPCTPHSNACRLPETFAHPHQGLKVWCVHSMREFFPVHYAQGLKFCR